MAGPFKMKGSPFQRNFGIGSPLHQDKKKIKMLEGTTIFGNAPKEFIKKAAKPYTEIYKAGKQAGKYAWEAISTTHKGWGGDWSKRRGGSNYKGNPKTDEYNKK